MVEQYGILSTRIERYFEGLQEPRDRVLSSIEKEAEENNVPIIGPSCGFMLFLLSSLIGAKKILEIGTATGYSAIWLARGLQGPGRLVTIEYSSTRARMARENFKRAKLENVVQLILGNGRDIVPTLSSKKESFDLVFLDVGEKSLYLELFDELVSLLNNGGLFVADNVLWNGQVADPSDDSEDTEIMRRFNKKVYSDKRLQPTIIPLRDGLLVARKK